MHHIQPKIFLINNHLLAKMFFFPGKIQSVHFPTVNNISKFRRQQSSAGVDGLSCIYSKLLLAFIVLNNWFNKIYFDC